MKTTLEKTFTSLKLQKDLCQAVYQQDLGQMANLLAQGASPNHQFRPESGLVYHIVQGWDPANILGGLELLTHYGANVNIRGKFEKELPVYLSMEIRYDEVTAFLQQNGAVVMDQLDLEPKGCAQACRYGAQHPERVEEAYFHHMFQTAKPAYAASSPINIDQIRKKGAKGLEKDYNEIMKQVHKGELDATTGAGYINFLIGGRPLWCYDRYGITQNVLEDGSLLLIGGEHEDYYDEQFWIYNDVVKIDPEGKVAIYFYPKTIFPPTDFHTATPVGDQIYIIGGLGYQKDRREWFTPVYVLDLKDFSIRAISTKGSPPGWISRHFSFYDEKAGLIYLFGGEEFKKQGSKQGQFIPNSQFYSFNISARTWKLETGHSDLGRFSQLLEKK